MGILIRLTGWKVGGSVRIGKAKWRILAVDREKHKALVISKEPLTIAKFHKDCEALYNQGGQLYWSNCSLRGRLNGDILNKTFSDKDKAAILTTPVSGGDGTTVQDKLFLLSEKEARKYFASDEDRMTTGRAWWLRDTESMAWFSAKHVLTDGKIESGYSLADEPFSVRPAMWVDTSKL